MCCLRSGWCGGGPCLLQAASRRVLSLLGPAGAAPPTSKRRLRWSLRSPGAQPPACVLEAEPAAMPPASSPSHACPCRRPQLRATALKPAWLRGEGSSTPHAAHSVCRCLPAECWLVAARAPGSCLALRSARRAGAGGALVLGGGIHPGIPLPRSRRSAPPRTRRSLTPPLAHPAFPYPPPVFSARCGTRLPGLGRSLCWTACGPPSMRRLP